MACQVKGPIVQDGQSRRCPSQCSEDCYYCWIQNVENDGDDDDADGDGGYDGGMRREIDRHLGLHSLLSSRCLLFAP